jgi:WD40 repeat protein
MSGRAFLVVCGVGIYDELDAGDQLDGSVPGDVERIVALFSGELGYEHVLPELASSPTATDLRTRLSDWIRTAQLGPEDRLVIYHSGHGESGWDGRHYLLCRDFAHDNYLGRALASEDIGRMLAGSALARLLVIIDACYAGEALGDLAALQRAIETSRREADVEGAGLYLVAASRRKEVAHEGAFSRLLVEAVHAERFGASNQRYLDVGAVLGSINRALRDEHPGQHGRMNALGVEDDRCPLLPNPRYEPLLPDGLDIAATRRLLSERDLLAHWGPRSRGVELESEAGDYFQGRAEALRALSSWLAGDTGTIRIVTGRPGSGKSALLARLAVLSDAEHRKRVDITGNAPAVGAIDIAVHARGKTSSDVTAELAAALVCEPALPAVVAAAGRRSRRPVVLVDALDEASDPPALVRDVLRELLDERCARLLVGTRPHLLSTLAAPEDAIIDLDAEAWFEPEDVEGYAARILGDRPELAAAVARRAGRTFLIAGLVARSLRDRDAPADLATLPETVGEAFEGWLAAFGPDERRVRDLLRALALAEGAGLPWEGVWPVAAQALSGRLYGDEDVEWLLDHAGAFILMSSEQGRTVYRLFHEALAEHLRPAEPEPAQRALAGALARDRDWSAAPPYLRTHLATHAAAGGTLSELLDDPTYLAVADPPRLLRALRAAADPESAAVRRAYRRVAHGLPGAPFLERLSYLELGCRQTGADALADRIAGAYPNRPWSVPWAHWTAGSGRILAGRHKGDVDRLAVTSLEDRPVIVSAGTDGTLRIWELVDGTPIGPISAHGSAISALAVRQLPDRTIAVTSGYRTAKIWNLNAGTAEGEISLEELTTDVSVASVGGRLLLASCDDKRQVRVVDPASGSVVMQRVENRLGDLRSIVIGWSGARPVVAVGGDTGALLLDLDGQPAAPLLPSGSTYAIDVSSDADRSTVICGGSSGASIWDLRDGSCLHRQELSLGAAAVALARYRGRACLVCGTNGGEMSATDIVSGDVLARGDSGVYDQVGAVAAGSVANRLILVSAGSDGAIQVWDGADDDAGERRGAGHTDWVRGVRTTDADGRPLVISCSDDRTVRAWDLEDGSPVGRPFVGHEDWVRAIVDIRVGDETQILSCSHDQTIRRWSVGGAQLGEPLVGHQFRVHNLATVAVDGRLRLISAAQDGELFLWDAVDGRLIDRAHFANGFAHALIAVTLDGRSVVMTAGAGFSLFALTDRLRPVLTRSGWGYSKSGAAGVVGGRPVAAIGNDAGTIVLRSIGAIDEVVASRDAHGDAVNAIVFGRFSGEDVVISGGEDGDVHVWWPDADRRARYAVGSPVLALALRETDLAVGTKAGVLLLRL